MIDTTGKCSACGQTVGIDTIHTCSPQVTAPKIVRKGPLPGDTNPVEFRLNGEVEWRSSVDPDGHWYIGTEYVAGLFNTTLAALRAELEGGEGNES